MSTEPKTDRHFGFPVVIDSKYLAIGANDFDILSRGFNAVGEGGVFIYNHTGHHQTTLTASDGRLGDEYGTGLVLADDLIVIGAPRHGDGGAVYVYNTTTWDEVGKLNSSVPGDFFGRVLDVRDGVMLIGSNVFGLPDGDPGYAQVFVSSEDSTWRSFARIETKNFTDFGAYVAIGDDGVLLVSAFQDFNDDGVSSGAIYAYNMTSSFDLAVDYSIHAPSSKSSGHNDYITETIITLALVGFFLLLGALFYRWRLRHKEQPPLKIDGQVKAPAHRNARQDTGGEDSPW